MSTPQQQLDFIERHLVYDISKYFGKDTTLIAHRVQCSTGLDGFMSAVYTVELDLQIDDSRVKQELVLVKFMKGEKTFRESSKAYVQFANEIFLYAEILPAYEQLLRSSHLNTTLVEEFVPRNYRAQFGIIEGLSEEREAVLALQHLKPAGYALGPRLTLRHDQLDAMFGVLGPYHALGYAIRILQPQVHQRLRAGVVDLSFVSKPDEANLFAVLYRAAFDRFYGFYDRCREELLQSDGENDVKFAAKLEQLRSRYFEQPTEILEHIRTDSQSSNFSTFLHGDFNRNNVLFREDEGGKVDNIKMIDFQELRYSTTAIDLSFTLYMNTPPEERETIFPHLLRLYHKKMHETLELVLQRNKDSLSEEQLEQLLNDYSFEHFEAHFKRYAFYGVMICLHFLPWLLGNEADCDRLSKLFETDMHGPEFHQLSIDIAGDEANHRMFAMVRHAYEQGYLDWI
ncbi:uncharacterized protein LOC117577528 [Drosophila albomicans]|uniref:Uncharacterized protein LOC117577528 n=1 Tax=Drosophila albomicans TaxID=7291 RepID=A0A6P8ZFJ4_DROAB|nr:uncharacterized protein LOC117577528 [Drosophila albomicans]